MKARPSSNSRSAGSGRLAILTPGMGAVSSTLFAGLEVIRKGLSSPVGSFTQLGAVTRSDGSTAPVSRILDLPALPDLVCGGWDIFSDNAYTVAKKARVIDAVQLDRVRKPLEKIRPMPAVFDPRYVRRITGPNVKKARSKMALAEAVRADIAGFIRRNRCDRAVMVNCASTEVHRPAGRVHRSVADFEKGLRRNDPAIAPSQIYTWAALKEGVPVANGTPSLWDKMPFLQELAEETGTPIGGCDFKTGQTLIKSILAPGIRRRHLGVAGWASLNILGNRDGQVLADPGSFLAKAISKTTLLESIFDRKAYPDLYGRFHHLVDIKYYPPRGDNKEAWDNIDIFGWLGYEMQLKINFLCRDSILAAPIVLDLALLLDAAKRSGRSGFQDWLAFFFKSPVTRNPKCSQDLAVQGEALEKAVREMGLTLSKTRRP